MGHNKLKCFVHWCRFALFHVLFVLILSVVMLSVVILSVIMLSIVMLCLMMLSVVMLSVTSQRTTIYLFKLLLPVAATAFSAFSPNLT